MSTHDEIVAQMEIYVTENNKFVEKGIKSSSTRARKARGRMKLTTLMATSSTTTPLT